ncbi:MULTISPECIES: DUF6201 family protein [Enterobacter]|uniref:DUF6201 family protein n=1 Tax=Enterobacter TaxID=547 RepID=UPI0004A6DC53|nr:MULTISPECIES: DUF6201 family protein [Enterobacter]MCK7163793.1 DUF6201 family protein [Enterobacter cloacae]
MIKNKYLKISLWILILILWMILSPTAFFGRFNQASEQISADGEYKVVAHYVLPTTPISLFQWMFNGDVFLVLYDNHNNYLGQSSPFGFTNQSNIFSNDMFFPDEVDGNEKSFSINGVNEFTEGYTIPIEHKKWWSVFYSIFY